MPGEAPASSDDMMALTKAIYLQTMMVGLTEVLDHLGKNHNNHHKVMELVREIYEYCSTETGIAALPPE